MKFIKLEYYEIKRGWHAAKPLTRLEHISMALVEHISLFTKTKAIVQLISTNCCFDVKFYEENTYFKVYEVANSKRFN